MDLQTFYSVVRAEHLVGPPQWGSLLLCGQERLTYRKAMEYLRPGMRVLDWGAGNGHFSVFLARNGFGTDAYMIDDPPALLRQAGIRFTKGADPKLLPYHSESFDAVFGVGVLEHVRERGGDERASLAELTRILKPDGLLFILHLPNAYSWLEAANRLGKRLGRPRLPHDYIYSRRAFHALLPGVGLKVIEEGRYNLLPRSTINRIGRVIADSPWFCALFDRLDDLSTALFGSICQNWYFVLQKRLR
jgi:ubiquinone/menaquinone biosynthesis C-methylase UbiE